MWALLPPTLLLLLFIVLVCVLLLSASFQVSSSELLSSIRSGYNNNNSSGSSETKSECDGDDNTLDHHLFTTFYYELNMTLCDGKCQGSCKTYMTPLSQCYSSERLFPNDPSWSGKDMFDTVTCHQTLILTRTIFEASTDGSCQVSDQDDQFLIPLNECVGPFGPPRPWGTFELTNSSIVSLSPK